MPIAKNAPNTDPTSGLSGEHIESLLAKFNTGQWPAALAEAQALHRTHAGVPFLHNFMGAVFAAIGQPEDAAESYRKAIDLKDDYADAHNNLGLFLRTVGRLEDSLQHLQRAVGIQPNFAPAYFNLGNTLRDLGDLPKATDAYQHAIALNPEYADAHNNLGILLNVLGASKDATEHLKRAISLKPGYADAHYNLGNVLQGLGDVNGAISSWNAALKFKPDYVAALNNIALAYGKSGKADLALEYLQRAIEIQPKNFAARKNLGNLYQEMRDHERALASYKAALEIQPDNADILSQAIHCAYQLCAWDGVEHLEKQRDEALAKTSGTAPPFILTAHSTNPAMQFQAAKAFCHANAPAEPKPLFKSQGQHSGKIRLAYVSADFREHAVAYLAAHLFECHDRSRFHVTGISIGPNDLSPMRQRLENSFDSFIDAADIKNADVAKIMADTGVDIAIDLNGHARGNRIGIFAHRPAPIQVTYLGYPGTTGAPYFDYLIGDPVVTPPEHQDFYSEKLIQLPGCYQVNDSTRTYRQTPSREQCGLPETGVVFCAFNSHYKITPNIFSIWMRLLSAAPESIIWFVEESPVSRDNLHATASAAGVDPARLVFAPRMPLGRHLARHGCADLFLDTMPYGAHTTASDALRMGVPVLTMLGKTFASRVAASQLRTLNMPELVTSSLEQYEELALTLARHPGRLRALKEQLKSNAATSDLFNTDVFRGRLEDAFTKMLEHYRRGQPVASFVMDDH